MPPSYKGDLCETQSGTTQNFNHLLLTKEVNYEEL
jgi:hypothetical protein